METLSFAFGMLTVVAVVITAVVIVGIVKVFKMQNRLNNLERWIGDVSNDLHHRITDETNNIEQVIVNDRKELNLRIDSLNSYVDSRFDKMENKFNGNSAKKQIIND